MYGSSGAHSRVELAPDEFGVVLLEVPALGVFEQFVTLVHFQAERLDGAHHLLLSVMMASSVSGAWRGSGARCG